jgi:hypothetical protein
MLFAVNSDLSHCFGARMENSCRARSHAGSPRARGEKRMLSEHPSSQGRFGQCRHGNVWGRANGLARRRGKLDPWKRGRKR